MQNIFFLLLRKDESILVNVGPQILISFSISSIYYFLNYR